jgi:hypothetical protein
VALLKAAQETIGGMIDNGTIFGNYAHALAGGLLRTSTRPKLNRRAETARVYRFMRPPERKSCPNFGFSACSN